MSNLRVGLIGFGVMGKNHARVLENLPGVDLVSVFDPMVEVDSKSQVIAGSFNDLLEKDLDYCVIATPTHTHEAIAISLANNGIHFLIEKPISVSLDSANRIMAGAAANKVIGGVGHIERYNAALIEAKKRIKLEELGKVYQISTRRLGPFPTRITDVGVTVDLATHDIDLTKWLAESTYESISAHSAKKSGSENEDLVSVVAKLKNGILVSHNVNWLSPLKERKIIVTGEKGTFVIDTLSADLTFYENGSILNTQREHAHFRGVTQGQTTTLAFEKPEALLVEHLEFRNAILGKKANIVTLDEAAETIKIAETILRSATLEKTIKS